LVAAIGTLAAMATLVAALVASSPASAAGVYSWGANTSAQLGNGSTTGPEVCGGAEEPCSRTPVQVLGLSGVSAMSTSVAAGSSSDSALAVMKDGTVMSWGTNSEGLLGIGTQTGLEKCGGVPNICSAFPSLVHGVSGAVAAAAGGFDDLAVLGNGHVMAWGSDLFGGLGDGQTGLAHNSSVALEVPSLNEVAAVASGSTHELALLMNGTVMAWGDNELGQLGNGTTTASSVPVKVSGLSEVVAISAGEEDSVALLRNGTVVTWGRNDVGQLGDGTSTGPETCGTQVPGKVPCSRTPVAINGLTEVSAIADGGTHDLALLRNGTVVAWGSNSVGELGDGIVHGPETCPDACSRTPVLVTGLSGVIGIASGSNHSLALLRNRTLMSWGEGSRGELGNGNAVSSSVPVPVTALTQVKSMASGGQTGGFSLALTGEPPIERAEYNNWVLSGGLSDKKQGQAITLPEGSTFNGSGEVNTETGNGSVNGNLSIPPFTTPLKLFGVLPLSLGVSISEAGPLEGALANSETVPGEEALTIPAKLNLSITSIGLFGLKLPTNCTSAEPVALQLTDTLTREELLKKGWSFTGTTTLPHLNCEAGPLGRVLGFVLSALLSGPENSYSLKFSAPAA
jgi:alpha-tubulin suppressor-like RCC1 family protein